MNEDKNDESSQRIRRILQSKDHLSLNHIMGELGSLLFINKELIEEIEKEAEASPDYLMNFMQDEKATKTIGLWLIAYILEMLEPYEKNIFPRDIIDFSLSLHTLRYENDINNVIDQESDESVN